MDDKHADGEKGRLLAAIELARRFHETYARLAPAFGEETRNESAMPWGEVPEQHKRLLVAVCDEIQRSDDVGFAPLRDVVMEVKRSWDGVCACHDEIDSDEDTDICGEYEDRFDAAITHLVVVLDGHSPAVSEDAT